MAHSYNIVVVFCILNLYGGAYATGDHDKEVITLNRFEKEKSLRMMAKDGRKHALKRFLKEEVNVDVNAVEQSNGWTALHYASDAGHDEVVSLLLKATKVIDPKDSKGLTPLHLATKKSFVKVVEHLVLAGATIGSQDNTYHWTPLHWAVYQNAVGVTAALLTVKTDINFQDWLHGQTPLHYAADAGHDEVVSLLLKATKQVDPKDKEGLTPLHLATKKSFVKVVEHLVLAGANIGSQDNAYHWTPLHWAVYKNAIGVTAALLTVKTDINFQDFNGETPLHLAAKYGHIDVLNVLLSAKPNLMIRDMNGKRALEVATNEQVKLEIMKYKIHEEKDLAAAKQMNENLHTLEKCSKQLQQTTETLLILQEREQVCLNESVQCLSSVQELNQMLQHQAVKCDEKLQNLSAAFQQNVTLLKQEVQGPGNILSTICIGAVVLVATFCYRVMNKLSEAEKRASKAEENALKADERARKAEEKGSNADERESKTLEKASNAERKVELAENRAAEAEARAIKAEERAFAAEGEAKMAIEKAADAEVKAVAGMTSWIIQREEIDLTDNVLGTWGQHVVRIAKFRGTDVAAKCLHHTVLFPCNLQLFEREMTIAAVARHPNLVLFIGATMDKECIILTELMPYSLREVLEKWNVSNEQVLSVAIDVCRALNYLHLLQPEPIVHRYVSSTNVLLQSLNAGHWRAKLSDYVLANFIHQLFTPAGSSAYAAPESHLLQQSPKMDTFSYGMLLLEMTSRQFPELQRREDILQSLTSSTWVTLITECTNIDPGARPDMTCILARLKNVVF